MSYETRVHGSSVGHPLSTLAEIAGGGKGWSRSVNAARRAVDREQAPLTPARLSFLNRRMLSPKRTAAWVVVLLLLLALAPAGIVLHEHDVRAADHADCDACHFRHLSGVESDGAPASPAPALVARAAVSAVTGGERGAALGIRPTRGPPA